MAWCRRDGPDLVLRVQVQPRAGADAIAGVIGDRLKIRLSAPPVAGKANERLRAFLAEQFGVPRRQVILEFGATSKRKQIRIHFPRIFPENIDWDMP